MSSLNSLFLTLDESYQQQILELVPEADPQVDVKRVTTYTSPNPKLPDVIMYTKSQLLQAKAQSGAPREGFRTAKNLILVLLVAIKPDVEGTFKSDMGKTGEMLTEISGISMNTRKNALGHYGTPRWNENVKFIGSLLTRSSSRSNLSPSKARESESSSLKSASKRA